MHESIHELNRMIAQLSNRVKGSFFAVIMPPNGSEYGLSIHDCHTGRHAVSLFFKADEETVYVGIVGDLTEKSFTFTGTWDDLMREARIILQAYYPNRVIRYSEKIATLTPGDWGHVRRFVGMTAKIVGIKNPDLVSRPEMFKLRTLLIHTQRRLSWSDATGTVNRNAHTVIRLLSERAGTHYGGVFETWDHGWQAHTHQPYAVSVRLRDRLTAQQWVVVQYLYSKGMITQDQKMMLQYELLEYGSYGPLIGPVLPCVEAHLEALRHVATREGAAVGDRIFGYNVENWYSNHFPNYQPGIYALNSTTFEILVGAGYLTKEDHGYGVVTYHYAEKLITDDPPNEIEREWMRIASTLYKFVITYNGWTCEFVLTNAAVSPWVVKVTMPDGKTDVSCNYTLGAAIWDAARTLYLLAR